MNRRLYLLDTSVVLPLVRGNELGARIDRMFGLSAARTRPFVSIVTHGEIRVLARRNQWAEQKFASLTTALANLVTVNIDHEGLLDAYVEIDLFSQGLPTGARNMGKNDLWIAACARASSATLLTTDLDFEQLDPDLLDVEWINPVPGIKNS